MKKQEFTLYQDAEGAWYDEATEGRTEQKFYVVKPDRKIEQEANIYYNKELRRLLDRKSECLIRDEVASRLRERGVWGTDQEVELKKASKAVSDVVAKLTNGKMKKDEAYSLAVQIIKLRNKVLELNMRRNSLDNCTAEAKADEVKFNYFIYRCSYYEDGRRYFGQTDFESMLESEDEFVNFAGNKLMGLLFDLDGQRKQLPEWKFLAKYGYADKELRLLDVTKSYFVDLEGRRIDEKGFYLDDEGRKADEFGNLVKDIDEVEFSD